MKPTLYLSFDVETDGPTPLINNMLSIGLVALTDNCDQVFEYYANIAPLEGHTPDELCMTTFWNRPEQAAAWAALQPNKRNYVDVCRELSDLFMAHAATYKLVFVAHPACFDWMFLKCYYELARATAPEQIKHDIGYSCQCSSTFFASYADKHKLTKQEQSEVLNRLIEKITPKEPHHALYDARCQGFVYIGVKALIANCK